MSKCEHCGTELRTRPRDGVTVEAMAEYACGEKHTPERCRDAVIRERVSLEAQLAAEREKSAGREEIWLGRLRDADARGDRGGSEEPGTSPRPEPDDPASLLKHGGEWLGAARSWIKWHCRNGDRVTWGSGEVLEPPMTVADAEHLAADVTSVAMRAASAETVRAVCEWLREEAVEHREAGGLDDEANVLEQFAEALAAGAWKKGGAK